MMALLSKKPDLTLKEIREALSLECTLPAILYALEKIGLTYERRHFGPVSKTVQTSRERARRGGANRPALIQHD